MKKRGLVISLLVMLAVITSGFTYAFWASGIAADTSTNSAGVIQVGQGATVTSEVNITDVSFDQEGKKLVPVGFAGVDPLKQESVTLVFTVDWDSLGADASGLSSLLSVSLTGATNGTPAENAAVLAMINTLFDGAGAGTNEYTIISDGSSVTVSVDVSIDEPADIAAYNMLANKSITLTFSFTVAATSTPAA